MNIIFLTILGVNNIDERGLYNDLMRTFRDQGHSVYVACPVERRNKKNTNLQIESRISILRIKTLNFQKTNIIEKGLSTILLEDQYFNAIKRYFNNVKFDLILYSTPPITFTKVVSYIKKRDKAFSYLLLKDIFPQNAVDLRMLKSNGILHRYFKNKEKKLYEVSDRIGCMSPANVEFVRAHNKNIDPKIIELNPNSIIPLEGSNIELNRRNIRQRYNIPFDLPVFIYGGNLGKPQGIWFLLDVLKSNINNKNIFFLIIGTGTEFVRLKEWVDVHHPANVLLLRGLQKDEYDEILQASDVGLIFLDNRFTIPNFPSRLLSYLEHEMPILAATDVNSDLGYIAETNGFGLWCESGDLIKFNQHIEQLIKQPFLMKKMGKIGSSYLNSNYTSKISYDIIMKHLTYV